MKNLVISALRLKNKILVMQKRHGKNPMEKFSYWGRECNFELNIDTDTKVIEKGLNNPGKYFSKNKTKKKKKK